MTESANATDDVLDRLMAEIHRRAAEMPPASYTTRLIEAGVVKMGAKILEEAAEVIDAAQALTREASAEQVPPQRNNAVQDSGHLIYEACDLVYHLWVLLGSFGITVDDLRRELARREGTSGLEEKRQRGKK